LRYSLGLREAHDAIVSAVGKAIAHGNRTGDIFTAADSSAKKVGTTEMGDAIAGAL